MHNRNALSLKTGYAAEYTGFLLVKSILSLFPMKSMIKNADIIGKWFFYYTVRIRRKVIIANLRYAFEEKGTGISLKTMTQKVYTHLFKTLIELFNIQKVIPHMNEYIQIKNLDIMVQALKKKRGVILVTGHFGNFELGALALAWAGIPVSVVAKPLRNKLIDKEITRLRQSFGTEVITIDNAGRKILNALRQNRVVCLLADQDVGQQRGTMVNFFGHPTSTPTGPARMALQTGALLLPCFIYRKNNGTHILEICQPIRIDYSRKKNDIEVKRITQEVSHTLERWVSYRPEQYFWLHRRWKSTEDGKRLYH